jgi:hypothetical protein
MALEHQALAAFGFRNLPMGTQTTHARLPQHDQSRWPVETTVSEDGWILVYPNTDYVDGEFIIQQGPPLLRRLTKDEQAAVDAWKEQHL